jgi:molybdate transport system substrate-binding protein
MGAFTDMAPWCTEIYGVGLQLNFDGAQNLRSMIEGGAYADIFVSDNKTHVDALADEGYVESYHKFLRTNLSLIVPKNNPGNIQNLTDLANPGIRIAIGSNASPIGAYTQQMLDKLEADPAYGPEYVQNISNNVIFEGSNVYTIESKVALGEADAGIAYKANVTEDLANNITKIEIPENYSVTAEYYLAVLSGSTSPDLIDEFLGIVENVEGKPEEIMEGYGFEQIYYSPL